MLIKRCLVREDARTSAAIINYAAEQFSVRVRARYNWVNSRVVVSGNGGRYSSAMVFVPKLDHITS